jgi:hypothetical protein
MHVLHRDFKRTSQPLVKISTRQPSKQQNAFLKGHGNEINFSVFCTNRFGIGPLQNCSTLSDFGVEFVEIFVIEIDSLLSTMHYQ